MGFAVCREHLDTRSVAIETVSSTKRLAPMPGGHTSPTTRPLPSIDWSSSPTMVLNSKSRPTKVDRCLPGLPTSGSVPSKRHAATGASAPLTRTISDAPSTTALSTSLAVDSLSITPPGGATDSIRCAMPTCTDRRVTRRTRTDLTRNDLTGVESHAQLKRHTVVALDVGAQAPRLLLDVQCGEAGTKSVVLQCNRRPEHRHDAVASELVHRPAVALHHRRRAVDQLGHDLA
jgi:hypothetical protein